jgi:hypothetical protein
MHQNWATKKNTNQSLTNKNKIFSKFIYIYMLTNKSWICQLPPALLAIPWLDQHLTLSVVYIVQCSSLALVEAGN